MKLRGRSLTVVGERLEQTVQAAVHAVRGSVRRHQLQLLQSFTQVVCKHTLSLLLHKNNYTSIKNDHSS